MLQLIPATADDRALLFNVNQKYLYEMTAFYDDPMDGAGNYHYGHFDEYFTDPRRLALLIYADGRLAGFAMLCPYSNLVTAPDQSLAPDQGLAPDQSLAPDHVMAEFTIFPRFRRRGLALEAARQILKAYPGRWEIKYNEKNAPAKALWNQVAAPYAPARYSLNDEETVLSFSTEAG